MNESNNVTNITNRRETTNITIVASFSFFLFSTAYKINLKEITCSSFSKYRGRNSDTQLIGEVDE
jgi:hypothetical protein